MEQNEKVTKVKDSNKPKKPNFFKRVGSRIKKFWKEYTSELKKVVWMPWKEIRKNTILVVVAVIILSAAIGIIDTSFGEIIDGIAGLVG